MKQTTETTRFDIKRGIEAPPAQTTRETAEPNQAADSSDRIGKRALLLDRAIRDIAVAASLLVLLIAMKSAGDGSTLQAVFTTLQSDANTEWDESLGKLSFVNNWLPQGVSEVWQPSDAASIAMPVQGEVVSAWTAQEPYLELSSASGEVHAVKRGEVMALAHGLEEELILRLRHEDGSESIYGNLAACYVAEGDVTYEGDVIAQVLDGRPLAFEYRLNGRSVDPGLYWADAQ